MPQYSEHATKLINEKRFRPAEGAKTDEAHPAIYPTGEDPKKLNDEESRVYDLITRRFLACFGDYSKSELKKVSIDVGGDEYRAQGESTLFRGWIDIYKYFTPKDNPLPQFEVAEKIKPEKVDLKSLKTLPPKRFSKASLISLLESKDLGTKATRAEIIDTLFRRDYVKGSSIEVTEFGLSVYNALAGYCPDILDEELTKKLETDMEKIQKGAATKDAVITEGKEIITGLIGKFKGKEAEIGSELLKGLKESENSSLIGPCKLDGGNLILRRSKAGKNFIGCSNYPKCTNTYSVPQNAKIVATGKICELCNTPKIKVFRKGRRPFEMDLDPNCVSKKDWGKPATEVKKASELKSAAPASQEVMPTKPAQPVAKETKKVKVAAAEAKKKKASPKKARKPRVAKKTQEQQVQ